MVSVSQTGEKVHLTQRKQAKQSLASLWPRRHTCVCKRSERMNFQLQPMSRCLVRRTELQHDPGANKFCRSCQRYSDSARYFNFCLSIPSKSPLSTRR
jgi:hypothetical protein